MDGPRSRVSTVFSVVYVGFLSIFILAPIVVVVAISVNPVGYSIFPPIGFSFRWYADVLTDPQWRASVQVSVFVALLSTVGSTVAGTLGAIGLYRSELIARDTLLSVFMSPLVLPGLVTGLAILFFFSFLTGIGTTWALVLGHIVITYPYVLRLVYVSLAKDTKTYEEAAATLGANEATTLWRVTLPLIKSGIAGGAIFAFIISFDNITVSIFLSNPRTITLPIRILEHIQWSGSPSVAAISTLLIVITGAFAVLVERTIGLQKVFGGVDELR